LFLFFAFLPFSIAGMELAAFFLTLIFIIELPFKVIKGEVKAKIGQVYVLILLGLVFWGSISFSAFNLSLPAEIQKYILISGRWALVFPVLYYYIKKHFKFVTKDGYLGFLLFNLVVGLLSLYQTYSGLVWVNGEFIYQDHELPLRTRGVFSNAMTFAYSLFLQIYLLILLRVNFPPKSKIKLMCLNGAILISSICLVFSQSKGVFLGLLIAGLFSLNRFFHKKYLKQGFAVLVILLLSTIVNPGLKNRIMNMGKTTDSSSYERIELWKGHIQMWVNSPIWGVGYRQTDKNLEATYRQIGIENGKIGNAHNVFLEMLAGGGIFTFAAYLAFMLLLFLMLFHSYKLKEKNSTLFLTAFIAFTIGGMTESHFVDAEINYMFLVLFSFAILNCQTDNYVQ
jgi:O-antigen ligase